MEIKWKNSKYIYQTNNVSEEEKSAINCKDCKIVKDKDSKFFKRIICHKHIEYYKSIYCNKVKFVNVKKTP